jgi:hypothetical protein
MWFYRVNNNIVVWFQESENREYMNEDIIWRWWELSVGGIELMLNVDRFDFSQISQIDSFCLPFIGRSTHFILVKLMLVLINRWIWTFYFHRRFIILKIVRFPTRWFLRATHNLIHVITFNFHRQSTLSDNLKCFANNNKE